jgi:hypothetical protein
MRPVSFCLGGGRDDGSRGGEQVWVSSAGPFALDAELEIRLTGIAAPGQVQFNRKRGISDGQTGLVGYVLR